MLKKILVSILLLTAVLYAEEVDSSVDSRIDSLVDRLEDRLEDRRTIRKHKREVTIYYREKKIRDSVFLQRVKSTLTTDPNSVVEAKKMIDTYESTFKKLKELEAESEDKVDLPLMPAAEESKEEVKGIDQNNNGTRDDLENLVFQSINFSTEMTVASYNEVIALMNMIQPQTPPVPNSINEVELYCVYRLLPEDVKEELSLDLLYSMVLNTKERKQAFQDSLDSTIANIGDESCE